MKSYGYALLNNLILCDPKDQQLIKVKISDNEFGLMKFIDA